jgi:diguanylate cyclase
MSTTSGTRPGAAVTGSGGIRRRRSAVAWLVLTAAVLVAGLGAVGIAQLQRYAAQRDELRVLLADIRAAAWQQSALEWQTIAERRMTPALAKELEQAHETAHVLQRRLARLDPNSAPARAVERAFGDYHEQQQRAFDLLTRGLVADAARVDKAEVGPAFDRLVVALDDADRRYGALAERASTRAQLGTVLILTVAATVIGALVWRFQRARSVAYGRVEYQALHDGLTGLPNRLLLHDRTGQAIRQAVRDRAPAALLLIDLDRFKEVNDTLGHHYGDQLLVQVARRLRGAVRDVDTVARLGGDEFAVLLPTVAAAEDVAVVAMKLRTALEAPFLLEGLSLDVDASIGAALYPRHGTDAAELLQRADIAMYAAKADHNGFALFDPALDHHSPRRLALLGQLRHAIEQNQLVLHFQPKIETRSRRVLGVEALVRWQHPEHGLIPPGEFIPLAEHTGLITPLTHFVLDNALRQCRSLLEDGYELAVAVNVSTRRLLDRAFPDEVADLLARWQIPARLLEIEITESTIMADPAHALEVLEQLNAMGVQLSVDDFGTGYSSMAYLKVLPVHELKVDRSFVSHMTSNSRDAVIVRSTVDLGRNLGLRVVAEGVEDAKTLRELDAVGCDAIQGYYISRPVPPDELSDWLNRQPTTAARRIDAFP